MSTQYSGVFYMTDERKLSKEKFDWLYIFK